jgi:hypothetical protein
LYRKLHGLGLGIVDHGEVSVDSRMSPDLLRGMGKSIGGDRDVDDEGSE